MSDQPQSATLEQTLDRTDFGHFLYENRKVLLAAVAAVLVAVTAWIVWRETKKSQALDHSVAVFKFQTTTWAEAKAGKVQPADLMNAFKKLDEDVQKSPLMVPVALEISKHFHDKGAINEAVTLLDKVGDGQKHPVLAFFVGMQRSVLLEKAGKVDEAIKVLEDLSKTKDLLGPAKVGLELGRLYLLKGEKGKAQTQFDVVATTYPNDEQAKLAKLYLAQLATK